MFRNRRNTQTEEHFNIELNDEYFLYYHVKSKKFFTFGDEKRILEVKKEIKNRTITHLLLLYKDDGGIQDSLENQIIIQIPIDFLGDFTTFLKTGKQIDIPNNLTLKQIEPNLFEFL